MVNGSKKPCTLTHYFDVITFGINYLDPEGRTHIGMGVGFAGDSNIERKKFWSVPHLQAADSHEVDLQGASMAIRGLAVSIDENRATELGSVYWSAGSQNRGNTGVAQQPCGGF